MSNNLYAQPSGKGFVVAEEEDGSPSCYGYKLKFANGNITDGGDGSCSIADQTSAGGEDNITVNTTAATNANFLDNIYMDIAIDTAATPDDITWKFNYAETLAGNPALLTTECIFMADGLMCEGTTADTIEIKLAFPDPATTDKTITLPNATDTLVGKATTDTFTNKTFDTAGTGNSFSINGTAISAVTGTGAVVLGTSPTFTTQLTSPTVIIDLLDASGAVDMDYGSADVTDHTFIADGTGDAEIVLPADSIGPAEIDSTTGVYDFGGVTSFEIPNGTAPTVDAAGEIAVDTTDDQFIYYGAAKRVIPYERTVCFVIENLAAADDNYAFYMANDAITITGVGCNCRGTCTTAATFTLEDRGGNAMTITGTNPTCATTGAATFAAVSAGGGLTAGEMAAFDVTNAVSPETDEYSLCITYTNDAR